MVNLTAEMAQLWASLGAPPFGQGRVVQFVAAARGEGTSSIAREFARFAAARASRPVWLVDLDLLSGGQHEAVACEPESFGLLGRPAAASPDGSAFFAVLPSAHDRGGRLIPDGHYLCAQPAGRSKLWVTRLRREMLRPGQSIRLIPSGEYWSALRRHAELVVIDAPAADRSNAALTVAPFADCSVLVVAAEGEDTRGPAALRDAIEQAGGRCAGLVFNRAEISPPKFLRRILR
jgi:Mrp family chromosome partitioning ATPase